MFAGKNPARERGQVNTIASAFAFVVFFFAVYVLVSFAQVGYQILSLDHALYQTSWSIDQEALDKMNTAGNTNTYLTDAIADDWTHIDKSALTVTNGKCIVSANSATHNLTSDSDLLTLNIERTKQTRTWARVSAHVRYAVRPILPVPWIGEVILDRDIDKTQQISSRFEVS